MTPRERLAILTMGLSSRGIAVGEGILHPRNRSRLAVPRFHRQRFSPALSRRIPNGQFLKSCRAGGWMLRPLMSAILPVGGLHRRKCVRYARPTSDASYSLKYLADARRRINAFPVAPYFCEHRESQRQNSGIAVLFVSTTPLGTAILGEQQLAKTPYPLHPSHSSATESDHIEMKVVRSQFRLACASP
jgi:hypothetical protein